MHKTEREKGFKRVIRCLCDDRVHYVPAFGALAPWFKTKVNFFKSFVHAISIPTRLLCYLV